VDNIVQLLKPFAGQEYALSVAPNDEAIGFMCAIDAALNTASWKKVAPLGTLSIGTDCGPAAPNVLSGLHIRTAMQAALDVVAGAATLKSALKAFDAVTERDPKNIPDPAVINIMVGTKP
jgi:hypothetical protein